VITEQNCAIDRKKKNYTFSSLACNKCTVPSTFNTEYSNAAPL